MKQTPWANLDIDQRAWQLAKVALGDNPDLHALVEKAQKIKEALKKG